MLHYLLSLMFVVALSANVYASTSTATQEQGQNQSQNMSDSGNATVTFSNAFNGSKPIRYLPTPSSVSVETKGGPSLIGSPNYQDYGPNFFSMRDAIVLFNSADVEHAEPTDIGDINMVTQLMVSKEMAKEIKTNSNMNQKINFSLIDGNSGYGNNFNAIAVVSLKADDGDSLNSMSLAVALANKARELGGNKIIFVREGVFKRLSSWGIGVGLASNYARVDSDSDGIGSTGTGGTGWSWGEAEYITLPYLTAVIGY
jgi:hypothetical protein